MENDMDTLDGVSDEEKQTAVAIWAMANSTMYLCGDLAKFNNFAKTAFKMMSSSVDSFRTLYSAKSPFAWSNLGFSNTMSVLDVWNRIDRGASTAVFATTIPGHGSRQLKVTSPGAVSTPTGQIYEI